MEKFNVGQAVQVVFSDYENLPEGSLVTIVESFLQLDSEDVTMYKVKFGGVAGKSWLMFEDELSEV